MAWDMREVDGEPASLDGVKLSEAFPRLEAAGADVLGLNCIRGPDTILPLMEKIKPLIKVCVEVDSFSTLHAAGECRYKMSQN